MKKMLSVIPVFLFCLLCDYQDIEGGQSQQKVESLSGNFFAGCSVQSNENRVFLDEDVVNVILEIKEIEIQNEKKQIEKFYSRLGDNDLQPNMNLVFSLDSKEEDCNKLQKKIKNREDILSAYRDYQLLDYANKHGMNEKEYDQAVWNLAEWIHECNPYEQGKLSQEQVEEFFTSKHKNPGDPTTKVVMQAWFDGTIRVPVPGSEAGIIIVNADGTKTEAYNTTYNQFLNDYGNNVGNAFFGEALAHEKLHCKLYLEGNYGETPSDLQTHEVQAYEASKESLKKDLEKLGCKNKQGFIEYNHNIKIGYGGFTENLTVTGTVPFEFEPYSGECDPKQKVKGSGNVSLTMNWNAEDCVGSGSSINTVELEGEIIEEGEENYIEMKFDEQWIQNMPITVTCGEETDTKNMPVPPPTKYGQMKFKLKDGDNITRQFSGMGGSGTYSWTIRIPKSGG